LKDWRFFFAAMAYGFPSILTRLRRKMMNYKTFIEEQIASIRELAESGR
jgi:hypothetical protein